MDYVKAVKDLVAQLHERIKGYNAEIEKLQKERNRGTIGPKTASEKIESLKKQQTADIVATRRAILSYKDKFREETEKANLIDGSMNNSDAAIFQSGIKLTEQQFNAIVERNRKNPFVIALARKYLEEHNDFFANMPPTAGQTIEAFDEFVEMAATICYEDPNSLRTAMFLERLDPGKMTQSNENTKKNDSSQIPGVFAGAFDGEPEPDPDPDPDPDET